MISKESIEFAKKTINAYDIQDNCATALPIYYKVQHRVKVVCPPGDAEFIQYHDDDGEPVTEAYDSFDDNSRHPSEIVCLNYDWIDDEQGGLFFTKKAAEAYLKVNRHNIPGEKRLYVGHFFRNAEMKSVLDVLRDVANMVEK